MVEPRVLVVGESLVDVVHHRDRVVEHVGGSAANTAVALSRLGVDTALATRVGADERGRRILAHLEDNRVALAGTPVGLSRTSTAIARIDETGAAAYEFDLDWDLAAVDPAGADALHVGSIGALLAPGCVAVHEAVEAVRRSATVSYDLNLRPQITGMDDDVRRRVAALVAGSGLVKASDEDLAVLEPDRRVEDAVARLLDLGPAAVVVTRGAAGASWFGPAGRVDVPVPHVTVVDTVAAGDTFGAALLAALGERGLLGAGRRDELSAAGADTWEPVLRFAAAAAAVTVSRAGADPPHRHDLPA